MNSTETSVQRGATRPLKLVAGLGVVTYALILLLLTAMKLTAHTEPTFLLPVLNTVFTGMIPLLFCLLALRVFASHGTTSLLLMGAAMFTFGVGGTVAGWLILAPDGPNLNVTVYNSAALLSSLLFAVSFLASWKNHEMKLPPGLRWVLSLGLLALIFLVLTALVLAALGGSTPVFFTQESGPTLLRQMVLGLALLAFLAGSAVSLVLYVRKGHAFHLGYAVALALVGLGLDAFFWQPAVGSPLGWWGRIGQYLGFATALAALLLTSRAARRGKVPLPESLSELFSNARVSYHHLVETVPDPILCLDEGGNVLQWNSAAARCFGYEEKEILGKSLFEGIFSRPDRLRLSQALGKRIELQGRTKNGTWLTLELTASAETGKKGRLYFCVLRDITERKTAEAKLLRLQTALEDSHRELETFSYSVSHELKAPARHVQGYASLLKAKVSPLLDEKALHYLQAIDDSAVKMGVLIDSLLEFSSVSRQGLRLETVDVQPLVQGVWEELEGSSAVDWSLQSLPSVQADKTLLRQVWVNLLSNAIKYSQHATGPRVEVWATFVGPDTVFHVRDNGAGFDMDHAQHLFGVFQRLHSGNEFEGNGVGLAMAQRIVQRHGGRIGASSAVGEGAEFWFSLPMAPEGGSPP